MSNQLPTQIPTTVFHKVVKTTKGEIKWIDVTTDDLFKNKKVVIFGLPGAFTPTCSGQQLPGYEQLYSSFREAGIDDIYCISVNDSFVMNEWHIDQDLINVKLIPDGSAEFTIKMGMDVRKDNLGFGVRSWRYAAIYDNTFLVEEFVEAGINDNVIGDPYEVSRPERVYEYVAKELAPEVIDELKDTMEEVAVLDDRYDSVGKQIELNFSDSTSVKEKIR